VVTICLLCRSIKTVQTPSSSAELHHENVPLKSDAENCLPAFRGSFFKPYRFSTRQHKKKLKIFLGRYAAHCSLAPLLRKTVVLNRVARLSRGHQ